MLRGAWDPEEGGEVLPEGLGGEIGDEGHGGKNIAAGPPGHECPGYESTEKPAEAGSKIRFPPGGAGFTRLFVCIVARGLIPGRPGRLRPARSGVSSPRSSTSPSQGRAG